MISLRPFQKDAIDAIKKTFESDHRQFIEMPTGSGKTITFLSYAKQCAKKILIIVPNKELLKQVYRSALNFYDRRHISRKGNNFDEEISSVHICIINSIRGDYLELLVHCSFDLIIIDEAHHAQAPSYKNFLLRKHQLYKKKELRLLGVTATPDRFDGLFLSEILGSCSYKLGVSKLINDGYLSDIEGFIVKTNIDISDIDSHNGDFSVAQIYKKLSTKSRNKMIVDLCKKQMLDRKNLIFCINIQHSKEICNLLKNENLDCAHIDGSMDENQRNEILSSFRNGEIKFLCNCQLLTEGFDEPSIDGIILARPTKSRALFTQMIGRGLRIYENKKNCKIIDIVDHHNNLAGFNEILGNEHLDPLHEFKSIRDIENHREKEILKISDYKVERSNILNLNPLRNIEITKSMTEYLIRNNISMPFELSFDECSFLIWYNELNKEYKKWVPSQKEN